MNTTIKKYLATLPRRRQVVRDVLLPIQQGKRDRTIRGMYDGLAPGSDGRIHTGLSVATSSGRLASAETILEESSRNLQNMANKIATLDLLYRVRDVLCADPLMYLTTRDYSSAEALLTFAYARDWEWVEILMRGESMHGHHAREFFPQVCGRTPHDQVKKKHPEVYTTSKNLTFLCVPQDTEILTLSGWRRYDEVESGDTVIGFDGEHLVWDTLRAVHTYEAAPVVQIGNAHFSARCTPDHRWAARRGGKSVVVTSQTFHKQDCILRTAPLSAPSQLDISPDEAELLGWLWGDGRVVRGSYVGAAAQASGARVKCEMTLFQAKPAGVERLRLLLEATPHREQTDKRNARTLPYTTFFLKGVYAQDLWARLCGDYLTKEQIVLSLDAEQRERFLHGFHSAEGSVTPNGTKTISQNEGDVLDAVKLAIFLSGHFPSETAGRISQYTGKTCRQLRWGKPHVTGQRLVVRPDGEEPVWCPETGTGFWVMRQGRTIVLTGNSLYSGGARTAMVTFNKDYPIHGQRITEKEVRRIQHILYRLHPLERWWEEVRQQIREQGGSIRNCFGTRRKLRDPDEHNRLKDALSQLPQSTVADLMNEAVWRVHEELDRDGEIELLHQNHDEMDVHCLEECLDECLEGTRRIMEVPFTVHGREIIVPTEASVSALGGSWGSVK